MLSILRSSVSTSTRQYARTFSLSARRQQHFLNVDSEGFEKAISAERSKDKVVLVDFYAE